MHSSRFPIFEQLDDEWASVARHPSTVAAFERWRRLEPDLARFGSVADAVAVRADPVAGNEVLGVLVARAGRERLAARVGVQLLVPGLWRLADQVGGPEPADTAVQVVSCAWLRLCAYPLHRRGSVAANVLWDVRKDVLADRAEPFVPDGRDVVAPSAESEAIVEVLIDQMRAFEAAIAGSGDGVDLWVASRLDGYAPRELVAATGVSRHALVQRRRLTERRLRMFLDAA